MALFGVGLALFIVSSIMLAGSMSVQSIISGAYASRVAMAGIFSTIAWIVMAGNGIWGLVEGILILTKPKSGKYAQDASGNALAQ
ncbi:hypothetical protein FWH09_02440 [Candidatus Saccharibacteria bacterium]|nr:hypothetical protein [Candidatus Saccharibacteria bacterium]